MLAYGMLWLTISIVCHTLRELEPFSEEVLRRCDEDHERDSFCQLPNIAYAHDYDRQCSLFRLLPRQTLHHK